MEPTFNKEVFGTTGWPKFGKTMVGGTRHTEINEFGGALDNVIGLVKKNSTGASQQYLAAFNALAVQLYAIGELCIDGKTVI